VEQGVPFCKQCGAPQIRVLGVEPEPQPAERTAESSTDVLAPSSLPTLPPPFPAAQTDTVLWSRALPGAALGGVFSLPAMLIPFAMVGPAFMLGGGLAVMLYRRASGGVVPTSRAGARIGAASGGFAFLYVAVLTVAWAVYRTAEVRDFVLGGVAQLASWGYSPETIAQTKQMMMTPDGLAAAVCSILFTMLLIMVAGSSIGGAFYAAWSRRRPRS
jgi:hypothetical protein